MSKLQKKKPISLLIASLLLFSSLGALAADGPFTLVGELDISGTAPALTYAVVTETGTQVFVFDPAATCTDAAGVTMLCTALTDDLLVEVTGNSIGTVYTASAVTVLTVYEGEVTVLDPLTLDGTMVFDTTGVTMPEFYVVGDTLEVTYKVLGTENVAVLVEFVASSENSVYEYEGDIVSTGETEWEVGDYFFDMSEVDLPIYYNPGDFIELVFRMEKVGGVWVKIVTEYTLTTEVDPKVESNRCLNDRHHPGVQKIADDEGVDYNDVLALFCKGFGLGEIKLAFRYSKNSSYTAEMLLDLRAMGYSWGDLKKMAEGNIPVDEWTQGNGKHENDSFVPGNGRNKEKGTPPGLANKPDKHDETVDEEESNVHDGPGNSENAPGQLKDKDNKGKNK